MVVLLAGQVIGGLILSHFGWLGSPLQPVSLVKMIGVAVMISGAAVTYFTK
jgi:transporter family-2 protein